MTRQVTGYNVPSIEDNRASYDEYFNSSLGNAWSKDWGSIDMQWYGALLPRIHSLLPARTILDLATGAGRWAEFLKDLCSHLILVDVSATAIQRCRTRFAGYDHIECHVNDGKSLAMVPDNSVDLIFSFNSLVHVDEDAMRAYISQFASKLTEDGAGFIHHSNLDDYSDVHSRLSGFPLVGKQLLKWKGLGEVYNRSFNVSGEKVRQFAQASGLSCVSQELITWRGSRVFLDCLTTFTRKGSQLDRPNKILWNSKFHKEMESIADISRLYSYESLHRNPKFAAEEPSSIER